MRGVKLDDRDLKILAILQRDGRISKTALADLVHLSPTPCWERLRRLEESGIIQGYEAQVSVTAFGPVATVFVQAELEAHRAEDFERFETAIEAIPEIVEAWAIGGGMDYVLKVVTRDVESYQALIERILEAEIGVKRYYTYLVTKPVKRAPCPPLGVLANGD